MRESIYLNVSMRQVQHIVSSKYLYICMNPRETYCFMSICKYHATPDLAPILRCQESCQHLAPMLHWEYLPQRVGYLPTRWRVKTTPKGGDFDLWSCDTGNRERETTNSQEREVI